jgi:phospholipase C
MKIVVGSRRASGALVALGILSAALCYWAPGRVSASSESSGEFSKIDHIVFIVQENRSFNNLFYAYPGATTFKTGECYGKSVTVRSQSMATIWDVSHGIQDAKTAYDKGAMDGFCDEYSEGPPPTPQYAYVPEKQVQPYWDMAKQYVLADHMFSSQLDGSFVAHQYLIAGWAGGTYNIPNYVPWGCDAPSSVGVGVMNGDGQPVRTTFPCFLYKTIASELDAKKVTWRTYAPQICSSVNCKTGYSWTGYDAIKAIREGPDWAKDVLFPETRILKDVAAGNLASVTWVIPSVELSDHAGNNSDRGPSWVASVVNAIGKSKFWDSTAIFVTWDDWGGWYDGVKPPSLGWDGLGIRVPLICISSYAKTGYVDHTQYEFASLLKLVEQRFDLPSLGHTDARAASPSNCFDFSQSPRKFQSIQATYSVQDVMKHATHIAPDDQ